MDKDTLKSYREDLVAQQAKALAVYHKAEGAIALIDVLLKAEPEKAKEAEDTDGTDTGPD